MEKENFNNEQKNARYLQQDEEQVLDLNELMDVQGGIDDKQTAPNCGLGCFSGGILNNSKREGDAANE